MTWKAYLGAGLLLLAFIAGDRVRAWRDQATTVGAIVQAVKEADTFNGKTSTHTQAAATRVEAVHADTQDLHHRIQTANLAPSAPTGGDPAHATFAAPTAARCPDYLAGDFIGLYDSGSAPAAPAEADHLPPAGH
jgi:hypothetical protein